jgi:hypothetical protein
MQSLEIQIIVIIICLGILALFIFPQYIDIGKPSNLLTSSTGLFIIIPIGILVYNIIVRV